MGTAGRNPVNNRVLLEMLDRIEHQNKGLGEALRVHFEASQIAEKRRLNHEEADLKNQELLLELYEEQDKKLTAWMFLVGLVSFGLGAMIGVLI